MRRISLLLAVLMALHPLQAYAQGQVPLLLKLQEGTQIVIKPPYDIRSDKVKTGDVIDFTVVKAVEINGVTVIEKGAKVSVTITEAKHASGFGQSGKLKLGVNTVTAADGTRIKLRGAPDQKGGDNTALSVAGMLLFSWLFIFMQGKEAVLKADKELNAYVDETKDFAVVAPVTASAPAALGAVGASGTPAQAVVVAQPQPQLVAVQSQPQVVAVQSQAPIAVVQSQPAVTVVQAQPHAQAGAAQAAPMPVVAGAAPLVQKGTSSSPQFSANSTSAQPTTSASVSENFLSPSVLKLVICCEIRKEQPRRASDVFGANAPVINAWFQLSPTATSASLEVRWYADNVLFLTTPVTMAANNHAGWASIRNGGKGLSRGTWRAELVSNGQPLARRSFAVTF